ncbi:hypothetical protein [Bacteroides acidifaciens]|uniref:hypothetical protein n=1 Tax=Bacteroides acidifaciens TaxID=85831 RepID=UPI003F68BEE7
MNRTGRQGGNQHGIAIEEFYCCPDFEYYNFIQQKIRLNKLSLLHVTFPRALRIAEASQPVAKSPGLDLSSSAKVDFMADSAQYIKHRNANISSRIQLI